MSIFAGTDSAPHTAKCAPCGCAAGCYTAGIAPQLYAQAFERAGVDLAVEDHQQIFKRFLCDIGRDFADLPEPKGAHEVSANGQAGLSQWADDYPAAAWRQAGRR